ncbi:hypothetical protein BKA57DRAFT_533690, partial [Linnemannia elongata]
MSSTTPQKSIYRSFGLKAGLMIAAIAFAAVASAAPTAPEGLDGVEFLRQGCPDLKVVDHGDWAETVCESTPNNPLVKRGGDHYWTYPEGNSYTAVVDSRWGTQRSVVLRGTWEEIVNQPQRCSGDGEFCFDVDG